MGQQEQGLLAGSGSRRLVLRSFLGTPPPRDPFRGWKQLHGCHGNQPPPLFPPTPQPAGRFQVGGRHRFAAGATSVGGVTGLLASRLRY